MNPIKKKKILIMTASGAYNLWDELILQEEIKFLQKHYWNVDITAFTYDKKSSIVNDPSIHFECYFPTSFFKKPFANIAYLFKNIWLIARADILVIGWWWIIFDNEPGISFKKVLMQWVYRVKLARITGTTLLFWWIWLEVDRIQNKMQLKKLFTYGDFILVRDPRSKWLLDALEIPAIEVEDIVYLYEPPEVPKIELPRKRVWISIRWWFLEQKKSVVPEIYDFLISEGYDPIFLLHTTDGNIDQNDTLYLKDVMVWRTYNTTHSIDQTLKIYPTLYAVVGMRFHSWILACVHEIPFIPISYWHKTAELVKDLELEHMMIKYMELRIAFFQKIWHNLIENYDREVEHMKERKTIMRNDLIKLLETL
jgi:polysaccharide pyruvyl transferase WcaK-like protein